MESVFFRISKPGQRIWKICPALISVFVCLLFFSCSGRRSSGPYYYDPAKDKSAQEKYAPPASPPVKRKYYYDPT